MKCRYTHTMRHPRITDIWIDAPCGKCLPCRVKKQSSWELRLRLEAWRSHTASFWTLTLDDSSLEIASEDYGRAMIRKFFNSLRASEARAGNSAQIRYFGCFEYGELSGRPHWHFLIYNLQKNYIEPERYRRGLPRLRHHIGLWPHGHVDVAEYNTATTKYVASYITDFYQLKQNRPDRMPVPFRSRLPSIGYSGIKLQAELLARQHSSLWSLPAYFQLGQRKFPLDGYTRNTFKKHYLQAGGKITSRIHHRQNLALLEEQAVLDHTPDYMLQDEIDRERRTYESVSRKKAKKEETFESALLVALKLKENRIKEAIRTGQCPF